MADSSKERLLRVLKTLPSTLPHDEAEQRRRTASIAANHNLVKETIEKVIIPDLQEYFDFHADAFSVQSRDPSYKLDPFTSYDMRIRCKVTGKELRLKAVDHSYFDVIGQFRGAVSVFAAASTTIDLQHVSTSIRLRSNLTEEVVHAILEALAGSYDGLTELASRPTLSQLTNRRVP